MYVFIHIVTVTKSVIMLDQTRILLKAKNDLVSKQGHGRVSIKLHGKCVFLPKSATHNNRKKATYNNIKEATHNSRKKATANIESDSGCLIRMTQ